MLNSKTTGSRTAGKLMILTAVAIALPLTATRAVEYIDVPAPPAQVPKGATAEWYRVAGDLQARGLLTESGLSLVASYVAALWQVQLYVKAIEKDGAFVYVDGLPKRHPANGLMSKALEVVARLGGELGLSPAARSRKALQPKPAEEADELAGMVD